MNVDLTSEDVAREMGVAVKTVRNNPEKFPGFYKAGGAVRFHKAAFEARLTLEEWRQRQEVNP